MNVVPLLRTNAAGLSDALHEGARLRRAGTQFDVELLFPDDRAHIANLAARDIVAGEPDPRSRRGALDALAAFDARIGEANLVELSTLPMPQREAARDLVMLARDLRVTSWAQARRFTYGLSLPPNGVLAPPIDPAVPQPPPELPPRGTRTLLWAPRSRTEDILIALAAVCEDGAAVDVVCAGGNTFGYAFSCISLADAARALADAGVIVAVDAEDASAAVSLSAWQRPLCATTTSGASMWLRGLSAFRPWSRPDLVYAVAAARGKAAPQAIVFSELVSPPQPELPTTGPSVCVVVRADGDAPCALTAAALECQRYRSFEVVTVHDDAAERRAAQAADAAFVMLLDDGDAPFPEALSMLVTALERSGADRVRGDVLVTYLADVPGDPQAIGFAIAGAFANGPDADARRGPHALLRVHAMNAQPEARVNAVVGTTYRHITGKLPFRPTARRRPARLPALPLAPRSLT